MEAVTRYCKQHSKEEIYMQRNSLNPIDWEQVRINAAIKIVSVFHVPINGISTSANDLSMLASCAVRQADALIEELKKK